MSIWLSQTDLEGAMSVATVAAIFDDQNTGTLNTAAMNAVIDRGEQEVLSWLVDEFGPTLPTSAQLATDNFLKYAALEYAVAFAFDRHPEYVRANGKERGDRFTRADARMQRILDGRQRPPELQATKAPANVGGVSVDNAARVYVDDSQGNVNAGDY